MEFRLPELGEGVYEAELTEWRVAPGQRVEHGDALGDVLTDKATMELPSPFSGVIGELKAKPGENVKVGQVVLTFESADGRDEERNGEGGKTATSEKSENAVNHSDLAATSDSPSLARRATEESSSLTRRATPESVAPLKKPAAPSVRRMARELGIDLANVRGSGPRGRVLIEDLAAKARQTSAPSQRQEGDRYGRPGQRLPLVGIRRKIADQMLLSKQSIPHYSYVDECDVTELVALRLSLKAPLAERGVKLTYLPFFLKAAALALHDVPLVNSSLDAERNEIVLHSVYHLGFAVAAESGLIVPVVRDADKTDVVEIAKRIERLTTQVREGGVKREELQGAVFTVTSIGNIGGLISTPIINPPQAAIMGVGRIVKRPVYDELGQLHPRDYLYLSFSFDHRLLDGAVGAAFGNAIKRRLESPAELLLPSE